MSNNTLKYNTPARFWTDALPMGNGCVGGMFFCGTNKDRIALNHDTLWTGIPRDIKKDGAQQSLLKAQEMVSDGNLQGAQKELENNFQTCWSQSYLPLGDIYLNFGMHYVLPENYERKLDISNAVLSCSYKKYCTGIKKEAFISNPDDVLIYKITSDKKIHFTLSFVSKLHSKTIIENETIITDGVCPNDSDAFSKRYPCNSLKYSENEAENGVSFRCAIRVVTDGKVSEKGNLLSFDGVNEAIVYCVVKTSFNGALNNPQKDGCEYKNLCLETLDNATTKGFEKIKNEHILDYKKYFDRVSFSLEKTNSNSDAPTDVRINAFRKDNTDFELYELLYNYSRYLLISSSRENSCATNLQGIWNEHLKAPWNSNYTVNINTEMNYWPVLGCNLPELMEPYTNLMKTLSVTGESVAKNYYNANGFVVHHNTDIWGTAVPITGSASWGFWNGGSGWLCHQFFEYYQYTLDKNYLEFTAYPIMKKAAEFYLDILKEDKNQNLIVTPATSPENTFKYKGSNISLAKTSTMLNTIVLDLFRNCKKSCEILGIDDEFSKKISIAADKIHPFKIGSKGQLLEWDEEYDECDPHHRHISHLIGLHPFNIINEKDTPDIFNACKKTIELRGDDGTGWSLAWKINFNARLKDGNRALKLIKMQLKPVKSHKNSAINYGGGGGTYSNLFDAHPPFQIDGNFGLASGINEMLLQSDGENIYLLPALPDEWQDGKVNGMGVKGNVTADFEWHNGKITKYSLHGENKDKLKVII